MRDLKKIKQISHLTLYLQICRNECFWIKRKRFFDETKSIAQWKRCFGPNGTILTAHKCTETLEPETLLKFRQHRFQILTKTESSSS